MSASSTKDEKHRPSAASASSSSAASSSSSTPAPAAAAGMKPKLKSKRSDALEVESLFTAECAICLTLSPDPAQRCLLNHCFHSFCMSCITEWGRVSGAFTCPLCKRAFEYLIYDLRGEHDFKKKWLTGQRAKEAYELRTEIENFRRSVYTRSLRAAKFTGAGATIKQTEYYRNRMLQPRIFETVGRWIQRELRVLLLQKDVDLVLKLILHLLMKYPVDSPEFEAGLYPYLFENVFAFAHELLVYTSSSSPFPLPLADYDQRVVYPALLAPHADGDFDGNDESAGAGGDDVSLINERPLVTARRRERLARALDIPPALEADTDQKSRSVPAAAGPTGSDSGDDSGVDERVDPNLSIDADEVSELPTAAPPPRRTAAAAAAAPASSDSAASASAPTASPSPDSPTGVDADEVAIVGTARPSNTAAAEQLRARRREKRRSSALVIDDDNEHDTDSAPPPAASNGSSSSSAAASGPSSAAAAAAADGDDVEIVATAASNGNRRRARRTGHAATAPAASAASSGDAAAGRIDVSRLTSGDAASIAAGLVSANGDGGDSDGASAVSVIPAPGASASAGSLEEFRAKKRQRTAASSLFHERVRAQLSQQLAASALRRAEREARDRALQSTKSVAAAAATTRTPAAATSSAPSLAAPPPAPAAAGTAAAASGANDSLDSDLTYDRFIPSPPADDNEYSIDIVSAAMASNRSRVQIDRSRYGAAAAAAAAASASSSAPASISLPT